jgi:hypothetical protein
MSKKSRRHHAQSNSTLRNAHAVRSPRVVNGVPDQNTELATIVSEDAEVSASAESHVDQVPRSGRSSGAFETEERGTAPSRDIPARAVAAVTAHRQDSGPPETTEVTARSNSKVESVSRVDDADARESGVSDSVQIPLSRHLSMSPERTAGRAERSAIRGTLRPPGIIPPGPQLRPAPEPPGESLASLAGYPLFPAPPRAPLDKTLVDIPVLRIPEPPSASAEPTRIAGGTLILDRSPATSVETNAPTVADEPIPNRLVSDGLRGGLRPAVVPTTMVMVSDPPPRAPAESTASVSDVPAVKSLAVSSIIEDEISIPPAIEDNEDEEQFFSQPDLHAIRGGADEDDHHHAHLDERRRRSQSPEARARREKYSKYVKWVGLASASLVLFALLNVARNSKRPNFEHTASQIAAVDAPKPAEPVVAAPAVAEIVTEPKAEPKTEQVAAASHPELVQPASAPEPQKPTLTAAQEKKAARQALERSAFGKAIEAGERSVAQDPTDGEAWLILGAAYQEKGKHADARRCFGECVKQGKRGPIGECRAMLR